MKQLTIVTLLVIAYCHITHSRSSNSWAVHVKGGRKEAETIAIKYGFQFVGQVGELDNVYHFISTNDEYRSAETITKTNIADLRKEQQVSSIMKQHARHYDKRGFKMPTDPLWTKQWAMHSTTDHIDEYNLRVVPAWLQGYTGAGVTVAIVDDGIEHSHSDLIDNYDVNSSFDFIQNDNDPTPYSTFIDANDHGTKCAGIIAMSKNNQKCGVGIAYDSNIAGLRLLSQGVTDILEATALTHNYNNIDIYSNSWGPLDNGYTVEGPRDLATQALEKGALSGRHGRGNIYVWASGNGGVEKDSCASDGFVNSIYTVAIGSVDNYGRSSYYDEECSAKLAVTFSYNSTDTGTHNPTTTLGGQCTETFTGTSAAAPQASSIIALTLQANPSLTWRDIQYLIVYTSNSNILIKDKNIWMTNGRGLNVSSQFGFGVMDTEAMVTRARGWTNVPKQIQNTMTPPVQSSYVNNGSSINNHWTLTGQVTNITYIEHVVLRMSLDILPSPNEVLVDYDDYYNAVYNDPNSADNILYHNSSRRGDIEVILTSPFGTKSKLLPFRKRDFVSNTGYVDWPFMSVQFWGEDPIGDWKCTVSYKSFSGTVKVSNIQMTLYGVEDIPESVKNIPKLCPLNCRYNKCSDTNCDSCTAYRDSLTLQCTTECPGDTTSTISNYCVHNDTSILQPSSTTVHLAVSTTINTSYYTTTMRNSNIFPATSKVILIPTNIDTVLDKPKEGSLTSNSISIHCTILSYYYILIILLAIIIVLI